MFSLVLFGGAVLAGPEGVLTGRAAQRHRIALLALLAGAGTGGMSREKLVAYLWPEADEERGRHLLSNSLYLLRQALGEEALPGSADAVRLDFERVRSDVREFEEALARGDAERAAGLYAGPFLDGFFLSDAPEFERWVESERRRLATGYAKALEALAEEAEARGDFRAAAEWWQARSAQDPYDSRVALRLMQALEAGGNRAGAIQHAATHQRLLQDELGMEPAPEVAALAERLRREPIAAPLPAAAPPAAERAAERAERVKHAERAAPGRRRRARWLGAAALAVAVVGGAVRSTWPSDAARAPSIVVLPFADMSAGRDNGHFSDGLTEEIIARLSAIPGLKTISRTSAMHYKGSTKPLRRIADELDVAHVLEGSVRESEGRLRITAQLIDARTDEHLWAESYDYEPGDVFGVQEAIASEVARALELRLGERERSALARRGTDDPEAYRLYRRGRQLWGTRTEAAHAQALEYYRRALARDSTYADAYAAIADLHLTAYQLGYSPLPESEVYSRIKWAAERALALDEASADAHTSFAIALWWQQNWPGAEREFRRALELNPGHASARTWYSLLLAGMGRVEEAVEESRRAVELDPYALIASLNYAWHCYVARDRACAAEQFRRTLELNEEWPWTHSMLGMLYARQGMHDEALRELSRALELRPNSATLLADLAQVHALAGRRAEAAEALRRAKAGRVNAFAVARAHAALGETDSAFAWLERRTDWRWPHRGMLADPALDPLRDDPRFARLSARVEREMGLR